MSGKSRQLEKIRLSTSSVRRNIKMNVSRRRRWKVERAVNSCMGLLLKKWGDWRLYWATTLSSGQDWVDQRVAQGNATQELKAEIGIEASTTRIREWNEVILGRGR